MELQQIRDLAEKVKNNVGKVIVGKDDVAELMMIALICGGNVLLEDVPGMGKTLLAKALSKSLSCDFKRIQFTPDLLPSDLSGLNFYNQKTGEFTFRPGPLFTNILLGDEINRATPRTQSSLLECMEEHQVTIDGVTRILDEPFMVIATQNPVETQGTFPLPEAQLDRFLMKIEMGYPTTDEGIEILKRFRQENPLDTIEPVASAADIIDARDSYYNVYVSDDVMKYMVQVAEITRKSNDILLGVSPRGAQALLKTAQVRAILKGRDYVTPEDVKALVVPVLNHRIILRSALGIKGEGGEGVLNQLLRKVAVPTEDKLKKRVND